jgi:branched-chain amino acid transport system permease protein
MTDQMKNIGLFVLVGLLIVATGFLQSWNSALLIMNMGLISAIMALGVNLQWGFAGLFNVGIMGFAALGGLATVLVAMPPVFEAWTAGGPRLLLSLVLGIGTLIAATWGYRTLPKSRLRTFGLIGFLLVGFFLFRRVFDPSVLLIEAINPAGTGYLGGLGLPVLLAWPMGGVLAAGAAWIIGKTALGLRSDYLAIATLGIAEIIVAVLKNEDWLARGVKNVTGIPRPVPYEVLLQKDAGFISTAQTLGLDPVVASSLYVKLSYSVLFTVVLLILLWFAQSALKSPWGRMMRAIRDNEVAAEAMGKDVTARHLQVFQPLRYTFLIWVMVIVGGSGNNFGAILGGFVMWFFWVQVEPIGQLLMAVLTSGLADSSALKIHLLDSVAHMRLFTMGLILLLVLRFSPRGLIPEK